MSVEREVIGAGNRSLAEMIAETQEKNPVLVSRAERKKQMTEVLDRGKIADRLAVDLPPDLYGEWVLNDDIEVARHETLGFAIDTTYAKRRRLHSDGTESSIVGDVVFMTCSREDHEIYEEIRREKADRAHNPRGQKEEKEAKAVIEKQTPEIPVIDESKARTARKAQIEDALTK